MTRMTTAEAMVAALIAHGLDTIYALPGVHNDPLFDALFKAGDRIRTIHTRHEQAASYMALGAALATGRPQAYTVVPGPGLLNSAAGLLTAYGTNAPVLGLIGHIAQAAIGRGFGHLHEIRDQAGIIARLVDFTARIHTPAQAPGLVAAALRAMRSGRPGPAVLECALETCRVTADLLHTLGYLSGLGMAQEHRLVRARPAAQDVRVGARGPLDEHLLQRPDQLLVVRVRVPLHDLDEPLESLALHVLGDLLGHARRVRPPPWRIDERERVIERHLLADGQRLREVVLALAGEADDHVGCQREARNRLAQAARVVGKERLLDELRHAGGRRHRAVQDPPGLTPEPFHRKEPAAMDTRLSDYSLRLAAGACTALGVVVVLVGYLGVRNESDVALQIPYLLSGGLGGLALVGLGALGLIQFQLRVQARNNARLIEELEAWKESALAEVRRFLEGAEIEVSVEPPARAVESRRSPAGAPV